MGLGDIYQNNVNKNPINQAGISSGIPASRERDPNQVKLENDVFAKMQAAIPRPKKEEKNPTRSKYTTSWVGASS